jgi:hypothetical protein
MLAYNTCTCGNRKEVADIVASFVLYANIKHYTQKAFGGINPSEGFLRGIAGTVREIYRSTKNNKWY